jgi:hypothetical protein
MVILGFIGLTLIISLVAWLSAELLRKKHQVNDWITIANDHVTVIVRQRHEIEQRERVIVSLLEREVNGTWLPNVGAEDLAKPRDNG